MTDLFLGLKSSVNKNDISFEHYFFIVLSPICVKNLITSTYFLIGILLTIKLLPPTFFLLFRMSTGADFPSKIQDLSHRISLVVRGKK